MSSSWSKPGRWRQSETFLKSVLFDAHAGDDDVDYDNYDGVDDVDVVIPTFCFFPMNNGLVLARIVEYMPTAVKHVCPLRWSHFIFLGQTGVMYHDYLFR